MKYDDASWHYEGDYPKDLPIENASTHIGIFLKWCLCHSLGSEYTTEECGDDWQRLKQDEITGAQFLTINCDGKFTDEDLSEIGNLFASDYYERMAQRIDKRFLQWQEFNIQKGERT